jgi:hypothetical protein
LKMSGFICISVGRGFTPHQAGRKGPPYGYEPGAVTNHVRV